MQADKDDSPGNQWYRAADAILKLCDKLGYSSLNVEIADGRGLIRNISLRVDLNHALVGDWLGEKKMFYRIMNALQNNTTWLTISFLNRGRERHHPKHKRCRPLQTYGSHRHFVRLSGKLDCTSQ